MKKALMLLGFLTLLMGCVQSGFIRPNPDDYAVQVTGLTLVDSESYGSWESDLNKSFVMIYYSEHQNFSNYIVKIIINETSAEQLHDYNKTGEVYHHLNVSEQYAWFFDQGLIIVEGTYADYGRVEYNKTMLDNLILKYSERFPPVKN